jgi:hypothetical protein
VPLVWEFTNTLRVNVLKRLDTTLFDFRKSPALRRQLEAILSNPNLHYEQMIGELEAICLRRGPMLRDRGTAGGLAGFFRNRIGSA